MSKENPTMNSLHQLYPKHPKERGEWVELLFMATAARLGLKVSKPHGDSAHYDVIVGSGEYLYRVQVKSCSHLRTGTYHCLCYYHGPTETPYLASRRPVAKQYTKAQTDFVAAYIVPEDAWFIIPIADIRTKTMYLPSTSNPNRNRYGQYLEAWHLLGARCDVPTATSALASNGVGENQPRSGETR